MICERKLIENLVKNCKSQREMRWTARSTRTKLAECRRKSKINNKKKWF